MSKIRKLIQEKFGYTTNLPKNSEMHNDVVDRKGGKDIGKNPAFLPIEKYRNVIKALMGATDTETDETDEKVENAIDFQSLERLATKHGLPKQFMTNLNLIQTQVDSDKPDREEIMKAWEAIKESTPFWFLGLLPAKDTQDIIPEDDKKALTNLMDLMNEFNKTAEKAGKAYSKDTEHASRDTAAKDTLDKFRKSHKIETEAGSEKKLKETPDNKIE